MMKVWMVGVLVAALAGAGLPQMADAKRFGGGKSSGMQRNMPERTAPATPAAPAPKPAAPGTPAQQPGASPAAAGAAAAPAAAAGRSWMGPIAGLAAGLGIAALLSHLGLGGAFAEFLMLALLVVAGFFLVRFIMRRMSGNQPAAAAAGAGAGASAGALRPATPLPRDEQTVPLARNPWNDGAPAAGAAAGAATAAPTAGVTPPPLTDPVLPGAAGMPAATADVPAVAAEEVVTGSKLPRAFVPSTFDSEGFARVAKAIFIRLQAAHDSADLDDIRRFTTPEMFAEVKLQLQENGSAAQSTEVLNIDATVIDVAEEDGRQVVSVRYRGQVLETAGGAPTEVDEVWHLVKPLDDSRSWAIAGIEQPA